MGQVLWWGCCASDSSLQRKAVQDRWLQCMRPSSVSQDRVYGFPLCSNLMIHPSSWVFVISSRNHVSEVCRFKSSHTAAPWIYQRKKCFRVAQLCTIQRWSKVRLKQMMSQTSCLCGRDCSLYIWWHWKRSQQISGIHLDCVDECIMGHPCCHAQQIEHNTSCHSRFTEGVEACKSYPDCMQFDCGFRSRCKAWDNPNCSSGSGKHNMCLTLLTTKSQHYHSQWVSKHSRQLLEYHLVPDVWTSTRTACLWLGVWILLLGFLLRAVCAMRSLAFPGLFMLQWTDYLQIKNASSHPKQVCTSDSQLLLL